jgi:hypothetical protein
MLTTNAVARASFIALAAAMGGLTATGGVVLLAC